MHVEHSLTLGHEILSALWLNYIYIAKIVLSVLSVLSVLPALSVLLGQLKIDNPLEGAPVHPVLKIDAHGAHVRRTKESWEDQKAG